MIADRISTGRGRADGKWRARAFTLIELLVVIALLGVLFSMTGRRSSKRETRRLNCSA